MAADAPASLLRQKLLHLGLNPKAVDAAWPAWWSEEAEVSPSARVELRFSVARKLGIDPRSLLEDPAQPRFVWLDETRFKRLTVEDELERRALASFGKAVASMLIRATAVPSPILPAAEQLRSALLQERPFIRLLDLLATCWSLGIPVVHLRIFPRRTKQMAAMASSVGDRFAILLGHDARYPARIAFYLAHELGHLSLGHVNQGDALVDLELAELSTEDEEERKADSYALELLTGEEQPRVLPGQAAFTGLSLARSALAAGPEVRIEPGTLALCFGYTTGRWKTVNTALRHIYSESKPVWAEVNRLAWQQLRTDDIPEDQVDFLRKVLGLEDLG